MHSQFIHFDLLTSDPNLSPIIYLNILSLDYKSPMASETTSLSSFLASLLWA